MNLRNKLKKGRNVSGRGSNKIGQSCLSLTIGTFSWIGVMAGMPLPGNYDILKSVYEYVMNFTKVVRIFGVLSNGC